MRKTRNFFLTVLGFFLLSVAFLIFTEVAWIGGDASAVAITVPATTINEQVSVTPEGAPRWLIPYGKIEVACNHPWVIHRKLPVLDHTVDELVSFGLSECYALAGEQAIYSHLWYQGIGNWSEESSKLNEQVMKGENIELFFKHNANFQALGLASPEIVSLSGYVVHDLNGDAIFNPDESVIPETQICNDRYNISKEFGD